MSSYPFPSTPPRRSSPTRPTISATISMPTLPTSTAITPTLPKSSSGQSISSIASPPKHPKNFHPYLIQTTSSSLLTRTNSSPSQPASSLNKHKPSRSMNNLSQVAQGGVPQKSSREKEEDRRRSLDSPGERRPLRKSAGKPSFLSEGSLSGSPRTAEVVLPLNPKDWTPSELSQYLGNTLRNGGPDGSGQILPIPLVEDIKSWVLRQRVNGRDFLRNSSDIWATNSRPPPFLPLLQTISRKLRRASLQGVQANSINQTSSILLERDESDMLDEAGEDISGVKRMANEIEMRDSASEASEEDYVQSPHVQPTKLKAQWTGGSDQSGWERWGVKKQHTGGSGSKYAPPGARLVRSDSASSEVFKAKERIEGWKRDLPEASEDKQEVGEEREYSMEELLSSSPEKEVLVTPLLDQHDLMATIKASSSSPAPKTSGSLNIFDLPTRDKDQSASLAEPAVEPGLRAEDVGRGSRDTTPLAIKRDVRTDITPTPDRILKTRVGGKVKADSGLGISPLAGADSPNSPSRPPAGGKYGSIGSSSSSSRRPVDRQATLRRTDSDDDLPQVAGRRVTIKQTSKSTREVELERELERLNHRIKALEQRLSEPAAKLPEAGEPEAKATGAEPELKAMGRELAGGEGGKQLAKLHSRTEGILDRFLGREGDDLPRTVGQLPGYLFLVGFGVGAVMMRVLFGRR